VKLKLALLLVLVAAARRDGRVRRRGTGKESEHAQLGLRAT